VLSHLAWQPLEKPVRPYAASQSFAVGDLVEHPKVRSRLGDGLGRAADRGRFADGRHTLVHVRTGK